MLAYSGGTRSYRILTLLAVGASLLFMAACSATAEPTATAKPAATSAAPTQATATSAPAKPKMGGNLRIQSTEILTWDPHKTVSNITHTAVGFYYSRLLTLDFDDPKYEYGSSKLVGDLADKWEISNDGLTYTIYLRKGVKWDSRPPTNGRELVAQDVKYSYERHQASKATNLWLFDKIARIETPDNYTVKFILSRPYSPFLSHLAVGYQWILPKEVEDQYGDFTKPDVGRGTGPWVLDKFEPEVRKVYKRNPNYYRKDIPYLDSVEIVMIKDISTQLAALRSGQLEFLTVQPGAVDSVKASNPEMKWYVNEQSTSVYNLAFRTDQATPFANKRVRQAVAMALDRKSFVEKYFKGQGIPANGPIRNAFKDFYLLPEQLGEAAKYMQYNPQEAKRLLSEAGYANGFKTPMYTVKGQWGAAFDDTAEWVVSSLAKIGVEVEMKPTEYGQFLNTAYRGDFEMMMMAPVAAPAGIEESFSGLYYPRASRNQSHTDDPIITKYIEDYWGTTDPAQQTKIMHDFQKYEAEQQNRVYLPVQWTFVAQQPYVRNYMQSISGMEVGFIYARVWLDK